LRGGGLCDADAAYTFISKFRLRVVELESEAKRLGILELLLDFPPTVGEVLVNLRCVQHRTAPWYVARCDTC
jgi:hypothetical protein